MRMQCLTPKPIQDTMLVDELMLLAFPVMEPFWIPDGSREWNLIWLEEPDLVEIAD